MLLSCPNLSLFQAQQDFDCFLVVRFHVVAEAGRVLESSPAEAALERTRCVSGGQKVEAGVGRLCHFLSILKWQCEDMELIEAGQCFISFVMIRYKTLRKNLTQTLYI